MTVVAAASNVPVGKPLRIALWIAQILVAVVFCAAGIVKFTTPIPELSAMMPWTGELPVAFVRTMGLIDLAGGVGILLPALTRIVPRLTVLAALCCVVLQVCGAGRGARRSARAAPDLRHFAASGIAPTRARPPAPRLAATCTAAVAGVPKGLTAGPCPAAPLSPAS
jgi:hypothetical protein